MLLSFPARVHSLQEWARSCMKKMLLQKNYLNRQMKLKFRISDMMFEGSDDDLKKTNVTQPAVFLHSVIAYKICRAGST